MNFDKLGLIFEPINAYQESILTRLSHALPCIVEGNKRCFFDNEEAELYKDNAITEGVKFLGYFNPLTT